MKCAAGRLIRITALGALLAAVLSAADRKVILVSIDGLTGSTLAKLPEKGLKTPNLVEFVRNGAVSEGLVGVFPTVTYPSHTTMVTGRYPSEHGIEGNTLFDPERKMNGAWYWYTEQIRVPTLWDVAHQQGLKTAAVYWPVTVGAKIDYNIPEFRTPRTIEDQLLFRASASPGLLAEFEKQHGEIPVLSMTDSHRAAMAAHLIKTRKPDLLLVHLIDMDHEEHLYGPDAPEALHSLEQIDTAVGDLRKAVREAGLEQQTVFVVVSDHGFRPVQKSFHPHAVLVSLGLAAPAGKPAAWRVAAHVNAGSFALIARDPNDTEAIQLATQTFQRLKEEGAWGIEKVATKSDLSSIRGYSQAFLAVGMATGFTAGGATQGPWLTNSGATKGTHGYWPGARELDASFCVFGPGIAKRAVGRGTLADIAPSVSSILNLKMPAGNGKNLLQ